MFGRREAVGASMGFCSVGEGELSGGGSKYWILVLKEILLLFEVVRESRRSRGALFALVVVGEGFG